MSHKRTVFLRLSSISAFSWLPLACLCALAFTAHAGRFYNTTQNSGNGPTAVLVNAFKTYTDSRQDLAIANYYDNTVTILLYAGGTNFTNNASFIIPVGVNPATMAVGTFNNDTKRDIVVANVGDNTVNILLGNGQGKFTNALGSPFAVGHNPHVIAVDNFNGGGQDIAVANTDDGTVSILLGQGNGTFVAASGSPINVGGAPIDGVPGDFNNDGKTDLVIVDQLNNRLRVLLGKGNGTFTNALTPFINVGSTPTSITVGDINNDGKPDLLVANMGDDTVTVLLGQGNGAFTPAAGSPIALAGGSQPCCVRAYNILGNTNLDFVVVNYATDSVTVYQGMGNGTFSSPETFATGSGPVSVYPRNIDPGSGTDLVVANLGENFVNVLFDSTPTANNVAVTLDEDGSKSLALSGSVRGGGSLNFTLLSSPTNGLLSGTPPLLTYTPTANYFGTDGFTYQVDDGSIASGPASVFITVRARNDAPSFTIGTNVVVKTNVPLQTLVGWATNIQKGPANESNQIVTFVLTNSLPAMFQTLPAISSTGTLSFKPKANSNGVATITVRLKDNGSSTAGETNMSPAQLFTITVTKTP